MASTDGAHAGGGPGADGQPQGTGARPAPRRAGAAVRTEQPDRLEVSRADRPEVDRSGAPAREAVPERAAAPVPVGTPAQQAPAGHAGAPAPRVEQRIVTKKARTSAAAALGLVLGLTALFCVLSIVLSPLALLLGVVGILVSVLGLRNAGRTGITGRWLAVIGLLLSVGSLVLSLAALLGVTTVLNDRGAVDRIEQRLVDARDRLDDRAADAVR